MILLIAALATYRLSRLVVEDDITEPLRLRVWSRYPPGSFLGDVILCQWCASIHVGVLVTLALLISGAVDLPPSGWLLLPFALSAIAGILSRSD